MAKSTDGKPNGCLAFVIVTAVLSVVIWGCTAVFGEEDDGESDAIAACHVAIAEQLTSPGSADFTVTRTEDLSTWFVFGYVDADNVFGASLRTNYGCEVEETDDGWRATTANLLED